MLSSVESCSSLKGWIVGEIHLIEYIKTKVHTNIADPRNNYAFSGSAIYLLYCFHLFAV